MPLEVVYTVVLVELATTTDEPCAITSGLIRGGVLVVGPTELKLLRVPEDVTAPTVSTLSPSAGTPSVLWAELPLLPAEFTTTMPRATAASAARVMTVVLPFMSCHVQLV